MSRPICSFYYQNHPVSAYQIDEVRSNATRVTKRSTSTKVTVQRTNQIQPSKIIIPKIAKPPQLPLKNGSTRPFLDFKGEEETIKTQKVAEQKHRLFSWKSLGNFCGISARKQSINGCNCLPSCQYKQEWSHANTSSDLTAYRGLKSIRPDNKFDIQINKDIDRTYATSATFGSNAKFRENLRQVLLAYSVYDAQVGYVQGMNLITANLIYHIKNPAESFWALVELMEYQELRLIYTGNLEHLGVHTANIQLLMKENIGSIYDHMMSLGVSCRCFLDGWLLSLMSKVIPLQQMATVISSFRKKGWSFIYNLVIQLLRTLNNCLLLAEDEPQFLICLDDQNCREVGVDWPVVVTKADKITK